MNWKSKVKIVAFSIAVSIPGATQVFLWKSERRNDLGHANNACIANLKQIQGALEQYVLENKLVATNQVSITDISGNTNKMIRSLINADLICPMGGTYSITTGGEPPRCSHPGHSLE